MKNISELPNSPLSTSTTQTTKQSTTPASEAFFSAVKSRRTYYSLTNTSPISDAAIHELVRQSILHSPSSFNSQSTRIVLLLGAEHEKLWRDIVKPAVKAVAPPEAWEGSEKKLSGFQGAYGTALFYEDTTVVKGLQEKFAAYADKFPQWSEHANGINTIILWTALETEGFGANLQHYNPLIDDAVVKQWNVPKEWSLKSQLVFGTPTAQPGEKSFKDIDGERLLVFGERN